MVRYPPYSEREAIHKRTLFCDIRHACSIIVSFRDFPVDLSTRDGMTAEDKSLKCRGYVTGLARFTLQEMLNVSHAVRIMIRLAIHSLLVDMIWTRLTTP